MTCRDLVTLMLGNRTFAELTRAERYALQRHVVACPACMARMWDALREGMGDDPARMLASIREGMMVAQADRVAQDPELT